MWENSERHVITWQILARCNFRTNLSKFLFYAFANFIKNFSKILNLKICFYAEYIFLNGLQNLVKISLKIYKNAFLIDKD